MKKFLNLFIAVILSLSMTSCMSMYAQCDDEVYADNSVSYTTVVTYGTPFYIDGVISYYLYHDMYYYPYLWNDIWYFHPSPRIIIGGFVPPYRHHPNPRLGDMRHSFREGLYGNHPMDYGRNPQMRGNTRRQQRMGNMQSQPRQQNQGGRGFQQTRPQNQSSTRATVRGSQTFTRPQTRVNGGATFNRGGSVMQRSQTFQRGGSGTFNRGGGSRGGSFRGGRR